jgi:PPM family protein phosphatase
MKHMHFDTASLTSAHGRRANQDFSDYFIEVNGGCWLVADGLGGHFGGEVASQLAVTQAKADFRQGLDFSPQGLGQLVQQANEAIITRQKQQPELASMRTTLVVLVARQDTVLWAHVGDSRLYHFRQGELIFQTKDHSVPQALANAGALSLDQIRFHEDRNRLLRALGQEGDCRPTVLPEKQVLQEGDVFLLCTDGFWEYVFEDDMQQELQNSNSPQSWLHGMEARLMARAQTIQAAKPDNYTAIGIFVGKP